MSSKKPVKVAKGLRERKLQRALVQYFKPENYFLVREALSKAGRRDLIGEGGDCLIPSKPPPAALAARRKRAQDAGGAKPQQRRAKTTGYRPGRRGAQDR